MRLFCLITCLTGALATASAQTGDPEFFEAPRTPRDFWRATNFELNTGQSELAARYLQGFLDSNPRPDDFLGIVEDRDRRGNPGQYQGMVPFLRLRNVTRWSADPATDRQAKQNVEAVIQQAEGALRQRLGDPQRVTQLIQAMVATPSERAYAEEELRRAGVLAMPVLLNYLQGTIDEVQKVAILQLLPTMDLSTVPAQVAFLDVPNQQLKLDMISALKRRPDVLRLPNAAETDPVPTMWYYAGIPATDGILLRDSARDFLRFYGLNVERTRPEDALTAAAERFYHRDVNFLNAEAPAVWRYEPATQTIAPPPDESAYTAAKAEEYFGLRYARWALERAAGSEAAQLAFLANAVDKAFLRFGPDQKLSEGAPDVYRLLTTAPEELLLKLLDRGLADRRSTVVLGTVEAIADRGIRKAALPYAVVIDGKPVVGEALLVRAMDFPADRRVQWAAADALLRLPGESRIPNRGRLLEVLRQAIEAAPEQTGEDLSRAGLRPKAVVGDPDRLRAASLAGLLTEVGYDVRTFPTGMSLVNHLRDNPRAEAIFLDQHLAYPLLPDTIAALRQAPSLAPIPLYLVASPEQPRKPQLDSLLLRLALLIATTDEVRISTTVVGTLDILGTTTQDREDLDARVARVAGTRLERLERLIRSTDMPVSQRLRDQMELFTLKTAQLELPDVPTVRTRITELERRLREAVPAGVPNQEIYVDRLLEMTAQIQDQFPEPLAERMNVLRSDIGRLIPFDDTANRDLEVEARLARLARPYRRTHVIAEPLSIPAVTEVLARGEPSVPPPGPEALKAAGLTSLRWLNRMADGSLPGFDVRPVAGVVLAQLESTDPEMATLAIGTARHLAGQELQQGLANVALTATNPPEVRAAAAEALAGHVQEYGRLLTPSQIRLIAEEALTEEDPKIRAEMEVLVGIFNGDSAGTTDRLLRFEVPRP